MECVVRASWASGNDALRACCGYCIVVMIDDGQER